LVEASTSLQTCDPGGVLIALRGSSDLGPVTRAKQLHKTKKNNQTAGSSDLGPVEAYFGLQYASVLGGEHRFMPPTSPMSP